MGGAPQGRVWWGLMGGAVGVPATTRASRSSSRASCSATRARQRRGNAPRPRRDRAARRHGAHRLPRSTVPCRLLAIPLVFALVQWVLVPAVGAALATNAPRHAVASARTLGIAGARDVVFAASDGVRLAGWYAPGHNGGAVILAHGSHGDRADTLAHLRVVARAGYAVLAYDARGHGRSAGRTNALGWQGAPDVAGAVAFLRRQPGVDPAGSRCSVSRWAAKRACARRPTAFRCAR